MEYARYPTKEEQKLSRSEADEYISIIRQFVKAKEEKDYELSDRLRKRLAEWQTLTSDDMFFSFVKSGTFTFHPFFEPIEHMYLRLSKR